MIAHSSVVICMLQSLPSIEHETVNDTTLILQMNLADVLKNLARSESNQHSMCDAGKLYI